MFKKIRQLWFELLFFGVVSTILSDNSISFSFERACEVSISVLIIKPIDFLSDFALQGICLETSFCLFFICFTSVGFKFRC